MSVSYSQEEMFILELQRFPEKVFCQNFNCYLTWQTVSLHQHALCSHSQEDFVYFCVSSVYTKVDVKA